LVTHGIRPAAAILAGGAARRMGGRLKALLELGGCTILDRQLAVLRQIADPIFLVSSEATPYAAFGLDVVPDEIPGCGALGGIYTAIVKSPRKRTIVVACDMPFISLSLLQRLIDHDIADIVIPRSRRGLEPLCAVYARECAEPIRQRLARGELEATSLPEGLRVKEIAAEPLEAFGQDGLLFVNVNTPHDYERARTFVDPRSKAPQDRIMDDPRKRS
jgi:molybdopterin-guanine dinucleotide biosynthesis protein A